jgi:SM-20-related protein
MDLGRLHDVFSNRIKSALPQVLAELGMEEFPISLVEMQITASNDGDYFHIHCDDGQGPTALRQLTFVYFFHQEPCQFEGGELRLYDANLEDDRYVSSGGYQTIMPQQNQIVFFASSLPHEITSVKCSSKSFADSRFTVNGWLRK